MRNSNVSCRLLGGAAAILLLCAAAYAQDEDDMLYDEEAVDVVEGQYVLDDQAPEYIEDIPPVSPPGAPAPAPVPAPEPEPEPEPQYEPQYEPEPPQPVVQPPMPPAPRAVPQARPQRSALPVRPPVTRATGVAPAQPAGAGAAAGNGTAGENRPKTGETGEKPWDLNYDNADLATVIASIAARTGRNFDLDPNIGSTPVTVISHQEMPPELAFEVLASILASRGFSMVETLEGNLIKILPTPEAIPSDKTPLAVGTTEVATIYDQIATHIVAVEYADAAELSSILQRLGSKMARIDVYVPTNTLIISDTADGLRRMFTFLEMADVPGFDTVMEIYTLEYTRAEVLMGQLEQVLLDEGGGARGPMQPGQPQQPRPPVRPTRTVRPTVPGAGPSEIVGSREEVLRMVPDERLNSLIVVASEGMMERVRSLVTRLDTPTPYEANNMHIYELLHADAEQVEQALQVLVGLAPRQQEGAQQTGPTAEVQPFERKVQVTRYDQTNSLLIVAAPQDYKLLEVFIARLDVPPRQVHVEAVVMDVTVSDDYGVTVDTAAISGADGFGLTSTANLSQIYGALVGVSDAANGIVLGPESGLAAGAAILGLGGEGGLTTGVFEDITFEYNGKKITLPFVPLLFQAIEKLTDVEVLSQPSLLTVDNEEASIVVGQEVPFVVGTSQPNTSASGNLISTGFTRVQREEIGVKLTVTPQISEGDYVALQMEIEISDLAAQQVGTVDILGPTTNKSLIKNRVVVKDGGTAVIAGLIRDNKSRNVTQSPVLGDLPLLGWMFRSKSTSRNKRNIVVLVTPHIVKEGVDLERVTRYKVAEYRDANIDVLFEKGFFQRIQRKREARRHHRPTEQRTEAVAGASTTGFGRGDIKR